MLGVFAETLAALLSRYGGDAFSGSQYAKIAAQRELYLANKAYVEHMKNHARSDREPEVKLLPAPGNGGK